RNGLRLICVVMASPQKGGNFRDSMKLFNYGFAKYAYRSFFAPQSQCGLVSVGKGTNDRVEAICTQEVGASCLKGEEKNITYKRSLVDYIDAPVKKGQKLGEIKVYNSGRLVKTVDLVAYRDVERCGIWKEITKAMSKIFCL
ncbi:MAG TPA: D-alanyl-D-alanine carboxypeptidase, partial [Syntrophothermus lipocalidus]|nr:D-alanyl-D-alanine carboxypeptidase [Syntrophothermus lipocalidus]